MALKEEIPPVWVRDESGRTWGPLALATLELMVDHGVVTKPFDYSTDGVEFQAATEDLLTGSAPLPAALAPPVLAPTTNAPTGSSAMKAAVRAARADAPTARAPGGLPPRAAASLPPNPAAPPKPSAPAAPAPRPVVAAPPSPPETNRVPRATTSKPVIAPPPPPPPSQPTPTTADGGMNLDEMLKDITDFKNKLPSEVLAEARRAAGLPDLTPSAPPPPPPPPAIPVATVRSNQAAPPRGRIEEISGLQLYYLIAAAEAGGLLTLGEGRDEVRLWFKQGTPHAVESLSQGLGSFLVDQGALPRAKLDAAVQQSPADPISHLFASGQLNPSAVFPLIQQHSLAVLQRALLLEKGPFTFDPEQPAPSSGFPLGNRWEILVGAARRLDTVSLERRLAGRENHAPRITGSTADLKLTALELRLVSSLDGSRTLSELVGATPAEADAQHRIIVLLQEVDRLAWQLPGGGAVGAPANAVPRSTTGSFKVPRAGVPRSTTGSFKVPPSPSPQGATPLVDVQQRSPTGSFKVPGGGANSVPRSPTGSFRAPGGAPRSNTGSFKAAPVSKLDQMLTSVRDSMDAAQSGKETKPAPAVSAPPPRPAAPAAPVRPAAPSAAAAPAPPKAAPAKASPPKTSPPRPPTGPPAPVIKAEDPGTFLAALRQKNYFERLGFAKTEAAPPQLKNVYFQYAKLYHPDMIATDATPEQRKQREDILALLNEAYAALADDTRRKEYLDELAATEAGLDAVDVEAILRAEEDFQRAVVLIKGHKVREGLAMIEACIKLNEKEGEFYAWRGYANFLLATDKKAAFGPAMAEVQKCLKMVARCPPAYLIEANMAKLLGDDETAKRAFKKVVELEPNNVEAARELRLYQQRAKK